MIKWQCTRDMQGSLLHMHANIYILGKLHATRKATCANCDSSSMKKADAAQWMLRLMMLGPAESGAGCQSMDFFCMTDIASCKLQISSTAGFVPLQCRTLHLQLWSPAAVWGPGP